MKENIVVKKYTDISFGEYFNESVPKKEDLVFEKYEELKKKGTTFEYCFNVKAGSSKNKADTGVLYSLEDGVRIELCQFTPEMCGKNGNRFRITAADYNRSSNQYRLEDTYYVKVKEVDRENKIVYLSDYSDNASQLEKKCEDRERLIEAMLNGIEKQEYLRVPARIIGLTGKDPDTGIPNKTIAMVDIGNLGIIGAVRVAEWSIAYTKNLVYSAVINNEIDVVVTDVMKWGGKSVFDCSRKLVLEQDGVEPWKNIEQRVPEGSYVRLTCIDANRDTGKYFGKIDGISELNVYLENPFKEKGITLKEGKKYIGIAYRVNESGKLMRVRIKQELNE